MATYTEDTLRRKAHRLGYHVENFLREAYKEMGLEF